MKNKWKKIVAGVGLCALMGTAGVLGVGCADMTDTQVKDALDTATEANETFKDMVELLEKQNADYAAQNEKYQELLAEKNAIIEKFANDKSRVLTADEAVKLLLKAQIDFEVASSITNNLSLEFSSNDTVVGYLKSYKKSNNVLVISQYEKHDNAGYGGCAYGNIDKETCIAYHETKDNNGNITESGKNTVNINIQSNVVSMFANSSPLYKVDIQIGDITQANVLEDGKIRIVVVQVKNDDYNTKKLYNILLDKDGKFLTVELDQIQTYNEKIYSSHGKLNYIYGQLTEEWANEQIAFIDAYEEPTE